MAEMDYAQVGLPRFRVKNEMSQLLQEEMSNLEATMVELRKSQAQFIEEVHTSPQEESNVRNGVNELPSQWLNWLRLWMKCLRKRQLLIFKSNPYHSSA